MRSLGRLGCDLGDDVPYHQLTQHLTPIPWALLKVLNAIYCGLFPRIHLHAIVSAHDITHNQYAICVSWDCRCRFRRVVWFLIGIYRRHSSFLSTLIWTVDEKVWILAHTLSVRSSAATIHFTLNFKRCLWGVFNPKTILKSISLLLPYLAILLNSLSNFPFYFFLGDCLLSAIVTRLASSPCFCLHASSSAYTQRLVFLYPLYVMQLFPYLFCMVD